MTDTEETGLEAEETDLEVLLTVKEVAALLRVGRDTAYWLVAEKRIPSIRLGRQIRIPRAALLSSIEREARAGTEKRP
jgi:excisionase family DNA binding protein